jgi:uncharacterized protein with von Willebrand factor type A (vWA) domain
MPAQAPLLRFFRAARGAGVRVSPAESIDAMQAVAAAGFSDRARLRDTLLLTLAKTEDEKKSLSDCFDIFFAQENFENASDDAEESSAGASEANPELGELAQMLLANDRAGLSTAMAQAADNAGLSDIRIFTQRGIYSRRILEQMGLERLERDIAAEVAASGPNGQRLLNARDALREGVRDMVTQAVLLYTREDAENLRNDILRNTSLNQLERRDIERMRTLVRQMAQRLRDRYSKPRRRKNRGRLDARRTIRRNASWGGIPFVTVWKQKRIDKPRIVALCDVSGSVARVAEFLLMFLYSLNEAVSDIRTFAFSSRLIEVSDILDANETEKAMQEIMKQVGFGSSDYGKCFVDFEDDFMDSVTNRTTVIILGDGRTNNLDPRTDILRRISERAKRVIWLNPERKFAWGTGDSEMPRYEPYCTLARPCGTIEQLDRVVSDILAMDR